MRRPNLICAEPRRPRDQSMPKGGAGIDNATSPGGGQLAIQAPIRLLGLWVSGHHQAAPPWRRQRGK